MTKRLLPLVVLVSVIAVVSVFVRYQVSTMHPVAQEPQVRLDEDELFFAGLRLGDTKERVLELFGDPDKRVSSEDLWRYTGTLQDPPRIIESVQFRDQRVCYIFGSLVAGGDLMQVGRVLLDKESRIDVLPRFGKPLEIAEVGSSAGHLYRGPADSWVVIFAGPRRLFHVALSDDRVASQISQLSNFQQLR